MYSVYIISGASMEPTYIGSGYGALSINVTYLYWEWLWGTEHQCNLPILGVVMGH